MKRHEFLGHVHRLLEPATYLEIGVNTGSSLALSRTKSIGIDPDFKITKEIRCDVSLARATSDDFFSREDPLGHFEGRGIELAFIDGMHLFEYALRDFMNVEQHSSWTSVIVFDDMLPRNVDEAARDRHTRDWAGDVYKVIPVLQKYRPDLVCVRIDSQPTGLLVVFGADPGNTVLRDHYDEILAEHVVPDPQPVPRNILQRTGAVPGEALLDAPVWKLLREERDRGTGRAEGIEGLRAAVESALPAPKKTGLLRGLLGRGSR